MLRHIATCQPTKWPRSSANSPRGDIFTSSIELGNTSFFAERRRNNLSAQLHGFRRDGHCPGGCLFSKQYLRSSTVFRVPAECADARAMHDSTRLLLNPGLADALRDRARLAGRWEACGVLIGKRDACGCVHAIDVTWLPNRAVVPNTFLMCVDDIEAAAAAAGPRQVVAIVHTHSTQSPPSTADLRSASASGWPWILATPHDLEIIPDPDNACTLHLTEAQP